jgi:hypothetical protein
MSKVTSAIEAKVREMFSAQEAELALVALSEMAQPPTEGSWANTRARVQAALLISSQSNIDKLLKGVERSQIDWRDTLVGAGLSDADWSKIAKEYGFDFT